MSWFRRGSDSQRFHTSADGTRWLVQSMLPGSSNVMILFRHPDGSTGRRDRYAWYNANVAEAKNVTARLDPKAMLDRLDDPQLALLFRRSMLVNADDNPLGHPVTSFAV